MPYLESVKFNGYPLPLPQGQIEFDERVNVFIGPNGSGKSTLLRRMKKCYTNDNELGNTELLLSYDWPDESGNTNSTTGDTDAVPLLYIPATRIPLSRQSPLKAPETGSDVAIARLFDTESDIFHGEYVESAILELVRDPILPSDPEEVQDEYELEEALHFGYSCAKDICSEVVHGKIPQPYLDISTDNDSADRGLNAVVRPNMGIVTSDRILGDPLYIGSLSAGTQGSLLWIWALALKIWHHYHYDHPYDYRSRWEQKSAVLLIDEIENHLHPTWQRRVIPTILHYFPGVQIFATTHSPFVVAGLRAGQVHLMERAGAQGITMTTNAKDIVGWTADEILRTMMGVEDPTDDATATAARELRRLRNEAPRGTAQAEAQRQQRMQELRQRVDRDLLAGGPMAAQRQLFEEQFAKTLEEYSRSRDLNQDNG